MIKDFMPRPYDRANSLPTYVSNIRSFELIGKTINGYCITLAKLMIGESMSAGKPLTHAFFQSYDRKGNRMSAVRTRTSGADFAEREFSAVKNAMIGTGVEFQPVTPCAGEKMLEALGDWFCKQNPDIKSCSLVSLN